MTVNYSNIEKSYNTTKEMKKSLDQLEKKYIKAFAQLEGKVRPSFLGRFIPGRLEQEQIKAKNLCEKLKNEWKNITSAEYPLVKRDDGTLVEYKDMQREMKQIIGSKDGYYHIPDEYCQGKFFRELRANMEKDLKQEHSGIPMEIGLKMEDIFNAPGKTWIHRTQARIEDEYILRNIARDGLICEISELDNTATPISNFTTFVTQTCNAWTYRHGSCHGAVIIKTNGEPEIHNQKLDPYQIVGFVSSDKSGLHDFVTREEMQAMEPEFDPEKYYEQFKDSTLQKESINPVEQMIDEAKHELETEGLNTEDKEISFPMKDFDLAI